jgi:hypothetical protein
VTHGPNPTAQGVRGYRNLSDDDIQLINEIKQHEEDLAGVWGEIEAHPSTDARWLAIARTRFQEGFSALVRSIAQPFDPFRAAFERNQLDEVDGVIPRREP